MATMLLSVHEQLIYIFISKITIDAHTQIQSKKAKQME